MTVQEIKAEVNIKDLISDLTGLSFKYNKLEKCPFCGSGTGTNKSSAFSVKKGFFKCFSCDKSGSVLDFTMFHENTDEAGAIAFLKDYAGLNGSASFTTAQPDIRKHDKKLTEVEYKEKDKFSDFELATLGRNVTPAVAKAFSCTPLEYYITKSKEGKDSYKISATPDYPIYLFSYFTVIDGKEYDFKRIYQPLAKDYRFLWLGEKPKNFIFADNETLKLLQKAYKNESIDSDRKADKLIICSGTSDAMNVYAEGLDKETGKRKYNVVWFNSETAYLSFSSYNFKLLENISRKQYIIPDLDETGTETVNAFALRFLDVNIVWLPEEMKTQTFRGKPLKDAKDFFNRFRTNKYKKLSFFFRELVRVSAPLRFWDLIEKKNADGDVVKSEYYLSNERIYQFLQANGFCRIPSKTDKKTWVFAHIQNKIVREINDESIAEYVNDFVVKFLKSNLTYYNARLIDKIHKSNEFKITSLSKLKLRDDLDFQLATKEHDYFIFKNAAWKITADGIEPKPLNAVDKFIHDFKVIDFKARPEKKPPFEITHSKEYLQKKKSGANADKLPDELKYDLKINDKDFSYLRYLYNTGRVHWRKELNEPLTDFEKRQQDLFFISKVVAIGYTLYGYKEESKAWAVYATDTEFSATGEHKGGTGKSIFMKTPSFMNLRNQTYMDGQEQDLSNARFAFGNVTPKTDFVFLEDVDKNVDLHKYMNVINGNMKVEPKNVQYFILPFDKSPKIIMNSNHAVKNLDASLRRRLWFNGFSDYYHAEDLTYGVKEHTPFMEFGKNLLTDYTDSEKNKLFNFLAACLSSFLKFRERIQSPFEFIEKRNLQRQVGDNFLDWAGEFFADENIGREIARDEVYESFIETVDEKDRKFYRNNNHFKKKLELFARSAGLVLNPDFACTEVERKRIRRSFDGKKTEFFYMHKPTKKDPTQPDEAPAQNVETLKF